MRVVRNNPPKPPAADESAAEPNQELVDRILAKISQSGYDSLTPTEKETLFKASKAGANEHRP